MGGKTWGLLLVEHDELAGPLPQELHLREKKPKPFQVITPSHKITEWSYSAQPGQGTAWVLGACNQAEEQRVGSCPCLAQVPFHGRAHASAVGLSLILQGTSCHPPGCSLAGFTPHSLPRSSPCAWCRVHPGK